MQRNLYHLIYPRLVAIVGLSIFIQHSSIYAASSCCSMLLSGGGYCGTERIVRETPRPPSENPLEANHLDEISNRLVAGNLAAVSVINGLIAEVGRATASQILVILEDMNLRGDRLVSAYFYCGPISTFDRLVRRRDSSMVNFVNERVRQNGTFDGQAAVVSGGSKKDGLDVENKSHEREQETKVDRPRVARVDSKAAIPKIWESNEPIYIGQNGPPVTLSHDSEIPQKDLISFLYKTEGGERVLLEAVGAKTFTLEGLAAGLHVNTKYVQMFYLRARAKTKVDGITIVDLNPAAVVKVLEDMRIWQRMSFPRKEEIARFVVGKLQVMGFDVHGTIEGEDIEIKTNSVETRPKTFRDELIRLRKLFPNLQSHFHLGVPTDGSLARSTGLSVARAVETMITLGLARSGIEDNRLSYTDYTSLQSEPYSEDRGVIRFGLSEYRTPFRADNIEIRQWNDLSHGLYLLGSAIYLVQNHSRLLTIDGRSFFNYYDFKLDPYIGPIAGALKYASAMLAEASKTEAQLEISRKLDHYYRIVERVPAHLDPKLRLELAQFLGELPFGEVFAPDIFLRAP